ncbi:MAG: sodium/pantothenate symporter [Aminobacterium sp.]|jgi:sodium/pantothenate symporter|uniref:sodium/pantothenate symporter n=1 Tax=unclassified Aminobacterium TaxID=2685012 RepID=UPI001BCCD521|nr:MULTISPECIES: sodium/pantothenate symporter [unclassified Aminobacterium]MDD2206369.1 sodium/pantothenate symporter [Aminobacterium sp.]MDD3426159.1 sodium/pantothenate symporter [Aminobacterium sp.]MDD3707484.1 sodium/pantothenate symporter [Aminobacterium sp.]MDD4228386.1 sodium/pantothenate symporter [Aminobacterium sp.]MDD4552282.1 sodium/pantothenate symporter [Aminobacterium sp.]
MTQRFYMILPLVLYLAGVMAIALWSRKIGKKTHDTKSFVEEYFLGSRSMGGFVLAMAIITTYTSASSFVGGPGVAYKMGLGWILLAMIQVPTAFLTLGVLGKKFAIIARRINAVTVTEFLRARYRNDAVVILSSIALLVFFMASMLAQFIGGARLFQSITGYPYLVGLIIFGVTVIIYTTVGGFRAVVLTDTIQGSMMVVASIALLWSVVHAGGGMTSVIQKLHEIDPALITPFGPNNFISKPFILSFWVLVGFAILGLPQTTVKCMGYKDARSMHNAMIVGTFIVGFLMLCMHMVGALGRAVVPNIEVGDLAVPTLTIHLLSPFWAGIFIAGPLAAIMSTVDSMLILASAAIIKDLYLNYISKEPEKVNPAAIGRMSFVVTGILGVMVFLAALRPPSLLVWINLFAFGGLEAVFLWPTILGLYWKRANATGAILSIVAGCGSFIYFTITKVKWMGAHQIVPTIAIGLIAFIIGAYIGKKPDDKTIELFWG